MYKKPPKLHEIQVAPNLERSFHNCCSLIDWNTYIRHHTRNFPFYFLYRRFRVVLLLLLLFLLPLFFFLIQVIQFWINDETTDKPDYLGNFSTTASKTTKTSTTMTHFIFFFSLLLLLLLLLPFETHFFELTTFKYNLSTLHNVRERVNDSFETGNLVPVRPLSLPPPRSFSTTPSDAKVHISLSPFKHLFFLLLSFNNIRQRKIIAPYCVIVIDRLSWMEWTSS